MLVSRPAAEAVWSRWPLAAGQHPGKHGADGVDVGHHVDVPRPLPLRIGELDTAGGGDSGVHAEQVDRAQLGFHLGDQGSGGGAIGDVEPAPDRPGGSCHVGDGIAVDVNRHHPHALGGETLDQPAPDPARPSGDHRHPTGQTVHRGSLHLWPATLQGGRRARSAYRPAAPGSAGVGAVRVAT